MTHPKRLYNIEKYMIFFVNFCRKKAALWKYYISILFIYNFFFCNWEKIIPTRLLTISIQYLLSHLIRNIIEYYQNFLSSDTINFFSRKYNSFWTIILMFYPLLGVMSINEVILTRGAQFIVRFKQVKRTLIENDFNRIF